MRDRQADRPTGRKCSCFFARGQRRGSWLDTRMKYLAAHMANPPPPVLREMHIKSKWSHAKRGTKEQVPHFVPAAFLDFSSGFWKQRRRRPPHHTRSQLFPSHRTNRRRPFKHPKGRTQDQKAQRAKHVEAKAIEPQDREQKANHTLLLGSLLYSLEHHMDVIKTILEQNQFYSIISSVCTTQVYRQPFQLW